MRTTDQLRPWQRFMARKAWSTPGVLFAAEPGLGKTGATLALLADLLSTFETRRALIVAPLLVAETVWPDEMAEWEFSSHIEYAVLTGARAEREAVARDPARVHIINRENIAWLAKFWIAEYKAGRSGTPWPYDTLIYDEASRLKGGRMRTKPSKTPRKSDGKVAGRKRSEFGWICEIRKKTRRVIELTGTPAPNGLQDLWGPIFVLDGGKRLLPKRTQFLDRWFNHDYTGWNWTPREGAHEEIMGRISDVMFGLRSQDYLDLPRVVNVPVRVRLSDALMEKYKKFARTLVFEDADLVAENQAVLVNKLQQFANGSVYRTDLVDVGEEELEKVRTCIPVHDLKLRALDSIVEEVGGAPVLCAYTYAFDLDRIRKKYPKWAVIGEGKAVDFVKKWNAGSLPGALGHPASMGHGLNIQFGGNVAVWYGPTWNYEFLDQFNRRLWRQGQKHDRVFIYTILCEGTIDEVIYDAAIEKGATQSSILDAVRVYLSAMKS